MGQGTELANLEEAKRAGTLNVLEPVISVEGPAVSPYLVASVQIVTIVPDVDTYHDFRYANARDGKHALSGLGLAKIAAAAGIKWIPELCRVEARERRPNGHVYVRFSAAAGIRQPNGEWHVEIATREIDTEDEEEELRSTKLAARDRGNGPRKSDEQIEADVRRDVLQIRRFVLAHAETKAKNRVIRRILALRQTYTSKELERPFAVPRLLYTPDYQDPAALERIQIDGRRAVDLLYGGQANTPALELEAAADVAHERDDEEPAEPEAKQPRPPAEPAPKPKRPRKGKTEEAIGVAKDVVDRALGGEPEPAVVEAEDDEPTAAETWNPPAQTSIPSRPSVDPTDAATGMRFSALTNDEQGIARLGEIAETSRAKARVDAANAWLEWATSRSGS